MEWGAGPASPYSAQPVTAPGDRTRARILDEAERLFGERGLAGVSLREIRLAAGARNKNAIQFHFGDRDGLVQALKDRHMPRLAAMQQTLYERMVAEGRDDDPRSMVEVLVRPSADYLSFGPSARAWVKIISYLGASPELNVQDMMSAAPAPAVIVGRSLFERLRGQLPDALAAERMMVLAQNAVHICADRARLEDDPAVSRRYVPSEVFVENLVDMTVGALFAPVSTTLAG
jgi:AcrR family transcriptional regulator